MQIRAGCHLIGRQHKQLAQLFDCAWLDHALQYSRWLCFGVVCSLRGPLWDGRKRMLGSAQCRGVARSLPLAWRAGAGASWCGASTGETLVLELKLVNRVGPGLAPFIILAVVALAIVRAEYRRLEALAVFLQTATLFAVAALAVLHRRSVRNFGAKCVRVPIQNLLYSRGPLSAILLVVRAFGTVAVVTKAPRGKAFTVQLEASRVFAVAKLASGGLVSPLPKWRCHHADPGIPALSMLFQQRVGI
mmetsp:Transcript_19172/g.49218  ORF Transcript_19172/g.49218 Transcript_19172/m.49218 type:complete len:247 (+) Transcript_19172:815-1555(+)